MSDCNDKSQLIISRIKKLSDIEYNSGLFGFALAQWMTKTLPEDTLLEIEKIITNESDIKLWKKYGANELTLKHRQKELIKFLNKIRKPRKKPIAKKPNKPLYTNYNNGCCLAFQLENSNYVGLVIFKEELFEKNGFVYLAFTTINKSTKPTLDDFHDTTFKYCSWSKGQDEITGEEWSIAGIDGYWLDYKGKKELSNFLYIMDTCFSKVGYLEPFEDGYHSTSSLISSGLKEAQASLVKELNWSIDYHFNLELDSDIFSKCSVKLIEFNNSK